MLKSPVAMWSISGKIEAATRPLQPSRANAHWGAIDSGNLLRVRRILPSPAQVGSWLSLLNPCARPPAASDADPRHALFYSFTRRLRSPRSRRWVDCIEPRRGSGRGESEAVYYCLL